MIDRLFHYSSFFGNEDQAAVDKNPEPVYNTLSGVKKSLVLEPGTS